MRAVGKADSALHSPHFPAGAAKYAELIIVNAEKSAIFACAF